MEKLVKLISNKIVINCILSLFWILLLSEKYEKAIAGDTKSIVFSLLYCLMLVFTTYGVIKAIKDSKTRKQ
jgi:hypothetical protein